MHHRFQPAFRIAALAVLAGLVGLTSACKAPSTDQVKASLEVVEMRTLGCPRNTGSGPSPSWSSSRRSSSGSRT